MCIYVCIYIYIYTYVWYIYIYIHTYISDSRRAATVCTRESVLTLAVRAPHAREATVAGRRSTSNARNGAQRDSL